MMRKSMSRFAVLLMACFVCFGGVMAGSTVTVEAKAAAKLSAKSVTIAMGGQKTIKLKNGKGKWTIQGNGVAKIKKKTKTYATITPIKAGTTTLTCKVGKKTLKCTVNVLNNRVGSTKDLETQTLLVGRGVRSEYELAEGFKYLYAEADQSMASFKVTPNANGTKLTIEIKGNKPGLFEPRFIFLDEDGRVVTLRMRIVIINGFRGNAKAKKTDANYKAWRRNTIATMVDADMSTWEIIDAIGYLISTGRYSGKDGSTGKQLWYGGNGTCVSGAKMMDDFLKDMGITSKVRFAGKDKPKNDIFGAKLWYGSQHRNVAMTLGGKKYYLNPQPAFQWPYGTIKR